MYTPSAFVQTDEAQLRGVIRDNGFGLLVSTQEGCPVASHLPLFLDVDGDGRLTLFGHMARANPQWHHFDGAASALAIFQGPHAYVSPRWYSQDGVPTWNYTAVHVYGRPRIIEDRAELRAMLARLTAQYEPAAPDGWQVDKAGDLVERMLAGIVGFEMVVDDIQGKYKLSQNRSEVDRDSVARHLAAATDSEATATASLMYALGLASR